VGWSDRLQRGTDLLDRHPKVLHGHCCRAFAIAQQGVEQVPIRPGRFERAFGPRAKRSIAFGEWSATPLRSATLNPFPDYGRVEIEGGKDGAERRIPALQEREKEMLAADVVVTQTRGLGPRRSDNIGQSGLASSISMIGIPSSTA